jgi:hypothetical protein
LYAKGMVVICHRMYIVIPQTELLSNGVSVEPS